MADEGKDPAILCLGDKCYLAWTAEAGLVGTAWHRTTVIWFCVVSNGGVSIKPKRIYRSLNGRCTSPVFTLDSSEEVELLWVEVSNQRKKLTGGYSEHICATRVDTEPSPRIVLEVPSEERFRDARFIRDSKGICHLVCSGENGIWYSILGRGENWSVPQLIAQGSFPAIGSLDSGNIFVIYPVPQWRFFVTYKLCGYRYMYIEKRNGTWQQPKDITDEITLAPGQSEFYGQ